MIESIKNHLWDLLKEKKVSLGMIYDNEGQILWHRGRNIKGKSIHHGEGFSRSFILEALNNERDDTGEGMIKRENVLINVHGGNLSQSAQELHVKSLLILPIDKRYYLYLDSGTREIFNDTDLVMIKMLGKLLAERIRYISKSESDTGGITGNSQAIEKVRELVLKYSLEEEPVLILGETGVGKSHIAELIHRYSGRRGKFVVTDVTTINENLFESEVFGYKKGSFTGAAMDKPGLVDEAKEGTLFFDEIAEVPVSFQAKLLRLIEKRKYRVVGETCERDAHVRIVTATNKDLRMAIDEKEFRQDLYFRLNVLKIKIPLLRERKEDIKAALMEKRKLLRGKEIGDGFWETMSNYDWPGNFRELLTVLKRAGILCDSPITGEKIRAIIDENISGDTTLKGCDKIDHIQEELKSGKSFWEVVKKPFLNRDLNREEVKSIISKALLNSGGKYVDMLPFFNIDHSDYKRFMKFIHKNKLQ